MNELIFEKPETAANAVWHHASRCPMHAPPSAQTRLDADDELFLPMHKRVITQYSTDADGSTELHLYYGDKEVSFDEPELFAFGERLSQQAHFIAKTATTWGESYSWPRIRELLEQLIEEGILYYVDTGESDGHRDNSVNPLPPAPSTIARTWLDCEAIMRELTGRSLELGYLELVVPIFRVAHIALDQEDRQVGEANVFPQPLRLAVPTEWHSCPFPGSRYQNDKPMNITALKSMRKHWQQTMAVLLQIREAYLRRFPHALQGWTVGDLERLSSLVLALPAYLLMRSERRVENGQLHPVLSSMFRVTDGVRMTMHQMLFVPVGESTLSPCAPMTSSEIYQYAERNYVFQSAHGVCAGPKAMIEEFLRVLVDGRPIDGIDSIVFDAEIQAALDDLDTAFDYGLYGLMAHAAVFSLWPMMTRTYEQLWRIVKNWPEIGSETLNQFRQRLQTNVEHIQAETFLATEEWRASREQAYADMYEQSGLGLNPFYSQSTLAERIAPTWTAQHEETEKKLRSLLTQRFGDPVSDHGLHFNSLVDCLMSYFRQEQAIVTAALEIQARINQLLGRPEPVHAFTAADIDIYNLLQGNVKRLPYLVDELQDIFGLSIVVTQESIEISDAYTGLTAMDESFNKSVSMGLTNQRAMGTDITGELS